MDELRLAKQALENTRNPIVIADGNAVVTYVNQACLDLWGYTNLDELVGKGIDEFWQEPLNTDYVDYLLATQGSWRGIRTAIAKNGATFSVLVSASAIMDKQNRPIGFVGSFMDMETMDRISEVRKKPKPITKPCSTLCGKACGRWTPSRTPPTSTRRWRPCSKSKSTICLEKNLMNFLQKKSQ
jgi:PAS domain S-box-containing protein